MTKSRPRGVARLSSLNPADGLVILAALLPPTTRKAPGVGEVPTYAVDARRFLLFLGLLQLVVFILVLLQRDILHGILPAELATALGSRPPKPALF